MRRYLFGTGLVSSLVSGVSLLRSVREQDFTWRTALGLISWGITLALAIGAIIDTRRASTGHLIADDSPVADDRTKLLKNRIER